MKLISIKTLVGSLLLFLVTHAENNQSHLYSELKGTFWAGTFQVTLAKKKVKPLPIEISFLNQQEGNSIGYTFKKDISSVSGLTRRGFAALDTVPCLLDDGGQEPRFITVDRASDSDAYSGKINLNDCKPDRKKHAQKVAKVMPISSMVLDQNKNKLTILVKQGPLEIVYQLSRIDQSSLKIK